MLTSLMRIKSTYLLNVLLLVLYSNTVNATNALDSGIMAYREQHYQEALNILAPLAKQNNPRAALFIAHVHTYANDPRFFDPELGKKYYQTAADAGISEAFYQLGKFAMLQLGGTNLPLHLRDKDRWSRALPYFKAAAEKGHVNAQLALSNLYYFSMGTNGSYEEDHYNSYYWGLAAAEQIPDKFPKLQKVVWHWLDGDLKDSISRTAYFLIHVEAFFSMLPKVKKWPSPDCAIESCELPNSIEGKTLDLYLKNSHP